MPRSWLAALLVPALLFGSGCATRGASSGASSDASPEELREMIDLCDAFLVMPEAVDPAPIVRFMGESPEVLVVLAPHTDGVATGDAIPKWASSMMLAAYIAGNVRGQLVAGRAEDDPVSGYRGTLSVYRALQPKGLSIADLDELDAAERAGGLDAWVESRLAG